MTRTASAPGKMMLLGEYAVLDGAPALVVAINRRARVIVSTSEQNCICAPEIGFPDLSFEVNDAGEVIWQGHNNDKSLQLLGHLISQFHDGRPVHIKTDTSAFYKADNKMGFGSSAALTVATATALSGEIPSLEAAVTAHRAAQSGRGSGFDIAAALNGGVIRFQAQPLRSEPTTLPNDLFLMGVWTGQSASTPALLKELSNSADSDKAMTILSAHAETAAVSLDDTGASWVEAINEYSSALQQFAAQTGLPVFSGGHADITEIAKNRHIAYKPSGAGGGDVGIAVSTNKAALASFGESLQADGIDTFELAIAHEGARFDS